jgi:hypothetical protein
LVTVKVEPLIVAGFIALLNVAVITAVLGQTRVEPSGGVTDVTAGGVKGSPGFEVVPEVVPAVLSLSLHPAINPAERNAAIHIFRTFNLRISFSSSPSRKAFHAAIREDVNIGSRQMYVCLIIDTIRYL